MESGKLKIAKRLNSIISEGNSLTFNCQLSTFNSCQRHDKLKFEGGRFVNRPYKVSNRVGPMV